MIDRTDGPRNFRVNGYQHDIINILENGCREGALRRHTELQSFLVSSNFSFSLLAEWLEAKGLSIFGTDRKCDPFDRLATALNTLNRDTIKEPNLTIGGRGESWYAIWKGKRFPLTPEAAHALKKLADARGAFVPAVYMRFDNKPEARPDRVIRNLPATIRNLIEKRSGRGGGFRLKS